MREGDQERLPYRHKFHDKVELITFAGRKPLCFRCGEVGHIRAECVGQMRPPSRRWETVPTRPRQGTRDIRAPPVDSQEVRDSSTTQGATEMQGDKSPPPSTDEGVSQDDGNPPPSEEASSGEEQGPPPSQDEPAKRRHSPEEDDVRTEKRARAVEEPVTPMDEVAPFKSLTAMIDAVSPSPGECDLTRAERCEAV